MADPYKYVISTGLIVPDTSIILTQVQDEWKQAFGADLIVTADTPQGVMIVAETSARSNAVDNNAAVANQINPNEAGGIFFDAIWALTGGERDGEEQTVVLGVLVTGVPFTSIPKGVQAKTTDDDIFQSMASIALDSSGNGVVDFQSVEFGAIPCPTSSLTTVVSGVLGWETVTNPNAGVLGSTAQSDQSGRAERNNTLALNGISIAEAITSALNYVTGVTSLSFRENYKSVPMGMLVSITGGSTLAGQIWGMTNTANVTAGTTAVNFARSNQTLPVPNPWPVAAFSTTANITLSGLTTQGGGDWPSTMTTGAIVLVKNQTTASQNGVYSAVTGAWARVAYNATGNVLLGSADGISLIKNSIYACVQGGSDLDVAAALLENKNSGCAWNGGVEVDLIEPASGQLYDVQFDRPTPVGILVNVTASNVTVDAVVKSILDYAAGLINGLAGFKVGADVSPFELSGAIIAENPGAYVSSVAISLTASPSFSSTPIAIGLNQIATTQEGYIVVTIA